MEMMIRLEMMNTSELLVDIACRDNWRGIVRWRRAMFQTATGDFCGGALQITEDVFWRGVCRWDVTGLNPRDIWLIGGDLFL